MFHLKLRKKMEVSNYARKIESLSAEIEKALVEFVNSKGGKIDTSNDDDNDTICAFVWDEFDERYYEKKVVEVGVYENSLYVTLEYPLSTESDASYTIFGGLILINATLYNICDALEQYIDEE